MHHPVRRNRPIAPRAPLSHALRAFALPVLTALAAPLVVPMAGCSTRNDEIDRVVDPYWPKSQFSSNDTWYYRASVIDTAPGASGYWWDTIASGHSILIERLRWEVTERHLIGYRDYAAAPGTEDDQWAGADDVYQGQPVAIFPITGHFDRRRTYDAQTGEPSNEVVENTEKPWFEREFFRVDWSRNLAPTLNFPVKLHQITGVSYAVQSNDPGDPKRWRFEDGYFETVTRGTFEPDLYSLYGMNGPGYAYDTAAMVLDVRHSFWKVDESAEAAYRPTPNPPSVVLENDDGTEVRDEHGLAVRVPVADRFGLFSTWGRNTWDPERGFTYSGKMWNATLFDIWERSVDEAGNDIPVRDRTPKPIVYYTNVTHPRELLRASIERVGGEWDRAFRDVVFHAQEGRYASVDDVPEMFIVRENDCNVSNVEAVFGEIGQAVQQEVEQAALQAARDGDADGRNDYTGFDGTLASVKARYLEANSTDNTAPFGVRASQEQQALEDLERICSALEWFTDPRISGDDSLPRFTYQRVGDLRYSLMNLVYQDLNSGWLGLGPPFADPLSGRTLSASANIAVNVLDTAVERYNQFIDTLNGNIEVGDLLYGFDVQSYMAKKLAESRQLASFQPSDELRQSMRQRIRDLGPAREALRDMPPTAPAQRRAKIAGTSLERKMLSAQDAALFGSVPPEAIAADAVDFDDAMLETLSPARGREQLSARAEDKRIQQLGYFGIDTPEFLDSFAFGLAMKLKDIPDREERRRLLRQEFYVGVQLHEVGHNVGLMHNFEASSDAINYGPEFWRIQQLPADLYDAMETVTRVEEIELLEACAAESQRLAQTWGREFPVTTQDCLGQSEHMYSSIMDYHGNWNSDFGGLGPYDKAAVKFGYAHLIETFPEDNFQFEGGHDALRRWTFLQDWRKIPEDVVDGYDAINERSHVRWDWTSTSTRSALPDNAVPYRFCAGGLRGTTPWCRTRDIGPDMRTNASLSATRYWQYYFFSHFNRDRLWDYGTGGGLLGAIQSDQSVMYDFTLKMQWYVYQSLTDPDFAGSYAEEDFLATTWMGMNHLSQVISHPRRGYFINTPRYDVSWLTADGPDADRLEPTDIMMPWDNLYQCEALSFANINDGGEPQSGKPGFRVTSIPLGDGRPFFIGLTEDYEEWYLRYVGTYWSKWDAIDMLGYNLAFFPGTNWEVDPRVFDLSWYRLFPREVERIIYHLVVGDYQELGPVVDEAGNYEMRLALDPATGEAPDYTGRFKVYPSIAFNHQYAALFAAHTSMSSVWDNERDFLKSFKVAVDGGQDDTGAFDAAVAAAVAAGQEPSEVVAEFVHPTTGERLRALKSGEYPVSYELVSRLNVLKERYEVLDRCVTDETERASNPYCACVQNVEVRADGRYCADPFLEAPGVGECAFYSLERRRDSAYEQMEDMVDFLDDVRLYNRLLSEW